MGQNVVVPNMDSWCTIILLIIIVAGKTKHTIHILCD